MAGRLTIYVARHGETDWNAVGRLQGQTDIPLNETGRAQARLLAEMLRDSRLGGVVSSDLARARQTGQLVAAHLGIPFLYEDPALRERHFGIYEGLTRDDMASRHAEVWKAWRADARGTPPTSEPFEALTARVVDAVYRAARRLVDGSHTGLVTTHGQALRALLIAATGEVGPPIPNVGVFAVEFDGPRPVAAVQLTARSMP